MKGNSPDRCLQRIGAARGKPGNNPRQDIARPSRGHAGVAVRVQVVISVCARGTDERFRAFQDDNGVKSIGDITRITKRRTGDFLCRDGAKRSGLRVVRSKDQRAFETRARKSEPGEDRKTGRVDNECALGAQPDETGKQITDGTDVAHSRADEDGVGFVR